jgi:predicted glycosyltransferase
MATEAAILGTPTIRCNSFVGERDMGNFIELEHEYGLIFNLKTFITCINKTVELLNQSDIKKNWEKKKLRLLNEKIDLSTFFINEIEKMAL